MSLFASILLFVAGLALLIYFSERLAEGTVGISINFGVSAFLISVVFIGFDPENLALGAVGSFEEVFGIAMGSVIGATMVAVALAFGITALIVPMRFEKAPRQILAVPVLAVILLGVLSMDGMLSRIDGVILLTGFLLSVLYLIRLGRKGLDIKPGGEVAETLEDAGKQNKWKSAVLFLVSLAAIIAGSEMLVAGSETIMAELGLSDTVFGMTILALLVSIEELARELPAAMKGRPEISFGNVAGSVLAFFLFNAGIIALVNPVEVSPVVLKFYLPLCFFTVVLVSLFMMTRKVTRWAGGILVLFYLVFVAWGYIKPSREKEPGEKTLVLPEQRYNRFYPGQPWHDVDSNLINAHGGSIFFENGTFYWYGEIFEKDPEIKKRFAGFRCYCSADLYNWKNEGMVLPASRDTEALNYYGDNLGNPYVLYNKKTDRYVLWTKKGLSQ